MRRAHVNVAKTVFTSVVSANVSLDSMATNVNVTMHNRRRTNQGADQIIRLQWTALVEVVVSVENASVIQEAI